jgi:hypothetical protein|tara:strand:- start:1201 stop:1581 length:381 start_codon:yes stop_codon:yes gene_type:complete
LITDLLRNKLAEYIVAIVNDADAEGDVGLGGNSTSPASTALDVPLSISTSQYVATRSDDNVIEIKLSVEGANITGKVIREASFGANENNFLSDGTDDIMISRVNFSGVGPFASNEILEIFLMIEVE